MDIETKRMEKNGKPFKKKIKEDPELEIEEDKEYESWNP